MKKIESDDCFTKLRSGASLPKNWDIIKKWGFCVGGENAEVLDINHKYKLLKYYLEKFSTFSLHALEMLEVRLFGKTERIKNLKREPI